MYAGWMRSWSMSFARSARASMTRPVRLVLTVIAFVSVILVPLLLWLIPFPIIVIFPFAFGTVVLIIAMIRAFYSVTAGAMSWNGAVRLRTAIGVIVMGEAAAVIAANSFVSIVDSRKISRSCTGVT